MKMAGVGRVGTLMATRRTRINVLLDLNVWIVSFSIIYCVHHNRHRTCNFFNYKGQKL